MDKSSNEIPGLPTLPQGYEYIDEISSGSYGTVWLVHNNNVNRNEAVKILHRTGSIEYRRFCQEIETIATLDHPNIVTIYYANPEELYFIMEYLEVSFETKIRKNASTYEGIKILKQVARGLHFAHQKGLVHRDLKPGNILFSSGMIPKITDFGLAKNLDLSKLGKNNLTGSHSIGTPRYMAPEQWENPKLVDHRSDLWPLGIMLYEILTKQYPFDNLSGIQLANAIISKKIPPPSKVCALSQWGSMAEAICMKALERDLDKRYQNAGELEKDLARILTVEEGTSEVLVPLTEEHTRLFDLGITAVRNSALNMRPEKSAGQFKGILTIAGFLLLVTALVSIVIFYDRERKQEQLLFDKQLGKLEQRIGEYKKKLEVSDKQLAEVKDRHQNLLQEREKKTSEQLNRFAQIIGQLEQQTREYRQQLRQKEQQLNSHERQLEETEQKLRQAQTSGKTYGEERRELMERLERCRSELNKSRQRNAELKSQLDSRQREKSQLTTEIAVLQDEIERLLPFENRLYKITLVSARKDIEKIYEALQSKGFHMRRSVEVRRQENTCVFFTNEVPPPVDIERKVRYIVSIISPFVHTKVDIRQVQAKNLDREVKIELAGM